MEIHAKGTSSNKEIHAPVSRTKIFGNFGFEQDFPIKLKERKEKYPKFFEHFLELNNFISRYLY